MVVVDQDFMEPACTEIQTKHLGMQWVSGQRALEHAHRFWEFLDIKGNTTADELLES